MKRKLSNIDKMYSYYQTLDKEGWDELRVVKKYIKGNIYDTFYYEDNCGLFENMDGKELIKWYEKMGFSEIKESIFHGAYEKCVYNEPSENKNYKEYKEKVKKEFIKEMDCKYNTLEL